VILNNFDCKKTQCKSLLSKSVSVMYVNFNKAVNWIITTTTLLLQLFFGPLSGTTWVSRYQKIHLPCQFSPILTISQPSYSLFHLLQSIASSLFNLHAWQSFSTTSLQVLWIITVVLMK